MNITVDGVTRAMTEQEKQALEKARKEHEKDIQDGKVVVVTDAATK